MANNYDVGYCKPPKSTQFRAGYSGNVKGRPKKDKNDILNLFNQELKEKVTLNDGTKITKEQAICRQQVNKAVNGNKDATKIVLNMQDKYRQKSICEKFVKKLIYEDYISLDEIKDFLKGDLFALGERKYSNAIWNINMQERYKYGMAVQAFVCDLQLADILVYIGRNILMREYIDEVKEEYHFYEGVEATLDQLGVSNEARISILEQLEHERGIRRPTQEVYECMCDFQAFGNSGLLKLVALHKQILIAVDGYNEICDKFLKKELTKEDLEEYAKVHSLKKMPDLQDEIAEMRKNYELSCKECFSVKRLEKEVKSFNFTSEKLKPYFEWVSKNEIGD